MYRLSTAIYNTFEKLHYAPKGYCLNSHTDYGPVLCFPLFLSIYSLKLGLQGSQSYFLNLSFLFHLKNHNSKVKNSKFELNGQAIWIMYEAILWFAVAYILLCMFNYGYHNQTRFHQYLTKGTYFSRKKLTLVMRKIWAFLWYQNLQPPKVWKKLKK